MNEQEVKYLKELTINREKLINELGEKEYARRLGEHVAKLMNNGYVCANFAHTAEDDKIYMCLTSFDRNVSLHITI